MRSDTRQCHNCGEVRHVRNQCPEPLSPRSVKETFNTFMSPQTSPQQRRQNQQFCLSFGRQCRVCQGFGHLPHQCPNLLSPREIRRNENVATLHQPRSPGKAQQPPRSSLICFLCNRTGHWARDCLVRPKVAALGTESRCAHCGQRGHLARNCLARSKPVAAMIREAEEQMRGLHDKLHELYVQNDEHEYKTNEPLEREETEVKAAACQPAHHCQVLIAVCQDCGQHHPVVADACLLQDQTCQMPVANGTVKGLPVSVLRDTGCSTVVVRRSLVSDEKLRRNDALSSTVPFGVLPPLRLTLRLRTSPGQCLPSAWMTGSVI